MASDPVTTSRRVALTVRDDLRRGLRLDVSFGRVAPSLESRDRSFVHELVYGTSRLQGRLDHLLSRKVKGGLERLDPPVLDILRLGAYQLVEMDGVPDYAAISQSVDLSRDVVGRGSSGLVNAVLRAVAREGCSQGVFPDPANHPAAYLATWGSHPAWLVERWLARWSFEDVERLVESDNTRPPLTFVPLDASPAEASATLEAAGIGARPVGAGTSAVDVAVGSDPLEVLACVPGIFQDAGANLVAVYADVPDGAAVADLCAAPGGKALAVSGRAGYVLAADRSVGRLGYVRGNAARVGRRMGTVVADAAHPPISGADVVLLDVPCSGTGTFRRHPDGRWRLTPEALTTMAAMQRRFLDAAADAVRPGGHLIYSTCSLEPEENTGQVGAFLARRSDYRADPTDAVGPAHVDREGFLAVFPQDTGFDGAFAARMRRKGS